jgi:hypothetical protein
VEESAPVAWLGLDAVPFVVKSHLATGQARFFASVTTPIHVVRLGPEFFHTLLGQRAVSTCTRGRGLTTGCSAGAEHECPSVRKGARQADRGVERGTIGAGW